jgi:hypothetical protein
VFNFFLWLNNIPWYYTPRFSCSLVEEHSHHYTFWLLGIMLLWTLTYKFLYEHMFSFLLGKHLRSKLLGQLQLHVLLWGPARLFSKVILRSYQQCLRVPISPHPHQHLVLSIFFIMASLVWWSDLGLLLRSSFWH